MWSWLIPLIKTAVANMSVECQFDWGTAFATASVSHEWVLLRHTSLQAMRTCVTPPPLTTCCFCWLQESRDPRKIHPLLELLIDDPLSGDGGSFGDDRCAQPVTSLN